MFRTERYYTSLENMSRRFRETERSCAFDAGTPEEFARWKRHTRGILSDITGLGRLRKCEPLFELLETDEPAGRGFFRHKLILRTEADVWMPFYLLEPKKRSAGKYPCLLALHGHGTGGKLATGGCTDIPEVREITERQNYTYGVRFAEMGFMVFCPDARGFGERRESPGQGDTPERRMRSTCAAVNHMAISLGLSLTGLWIWDLMRLVDYIESRGDCGRIACAGLSGGGLQALWLAAMDDRIAAAAVSGYFYGYRDSLLEMNGNCSCNYVPHLWEHVDMGDIGALIAPRPFAIETGDLDRLNGAGGLENVLKQVATVRKAYDIFGASERLLHDVFEGGHRWNGKRSEDFIQRQLMSGEK